MTVQSAGILTGSLKVIALKDVNAMILWKLSVYLKKVGL